MKGKRTDGQPVAFHARSNRRAIYWRKGRVLDDGSDVVFPDGRKMSDIIRAMRHAIADGFVPEITLSIRTPDR